MSWPSALKGFGVSKEEMASMSVNVPKGARETCIIDPETRRGRRLLRIWDPIMIIAMLFVTYVTPVEVAFLPGSCIDTLFVLNRIIDVIFYIDMAITFRLAFYDTRRGRYVRNAKGIFWNCETPR